MRARSREVSAIRVSRREGQIVQNFSVFIYFLPFLNTTSVPKSALLLRSQCRDNIRAGLLNFYRRNFPKLAAKSAGTLQVEKIKMAFVAIIGRR